MPQTKIGSGFVATGAVGPTSLSTGAPYWDTSGNVGIGTTSPGSILDVQSATSIIRNTATTGTNQAAIRQGNTGGFFYTGIDTSTGGFLTGANYAAFHWMSGAYPMIFATNNSERMRIDSSGNVGIGTSSPGVRLDVTQNTAADAIISIYNANSGAYGTNLVLNSLNATGSYYNAIVSKTAGTEAWRIDGRGSANTIAFSNGSSATERMRIDSSGNLIVGATSFSSGTNSLRLAPGNLSIRCNVSTTYEVCNWLNSNGQVGTISLNGTSTSYNTSSDYRLKENVQPMTTGLTTVSALKPVTYDWVSDKSAGEGFIAHELQSVIPLAVTGEKDAVDEEGNIKPQGVDYSKIVVHLVAAIQELTAKVTALEAKVGL